MTQWVSTLILLMTILNLFHTLFYSLYTDLKYDLTWNNIDPEITQLTEMYKNKVFWRYQIHR